MKIINVAIADDHKIIRDGLRSLIEKKSGSLTIIGEAQNGIELIELFKHNDIDLAIIDISMGPMDGIEASKIIKKEFPNTKILILSMHKEKNFVLASLKAQADGYILKECAFEELILAIKTVLENRIFLSSTINDLVIQEYLNLQNPSQRGETNASSLTPRESEILKLIADGLSTKEIAHQLNVSPKTIESHRLQIMEKLKITSIAHLIRYAIKEGLSSL